VKIRVAELMISCASAGQFPSGGLPEVAFLGRSNVGKSSLLNALVRRRQLARTSGTPGKTRLVHFFRVVAGDLELAFVDLPGYGWARVSKRERESWGQLVEGYLDARPGLRLAILLQDVRRDISEDETLLLDWLAERGVPWQVVVTKADKLKPMRRAQRLAELGRQLDRGGPALVATSSESRLGIDTLWRVIRDRIDPQPEVAAPSSPSSPNSPNSKKDRRD
jgi:GTP-binding protein